MFLSITLLYLYYDIDKMLQFIKMMINKEYGKTVLTVTKNKTQDKVIEYLINNCQDKKSLIWYYSQEEAEKASKELGLKKFYFDKVLKSLVGLGVLLKKTKGVYILSKEFFQVKEEDKTK